MGRTIRSALAITLGAAVMGCSQATSRPRYSEPEPRHAEPRVVYRDRLTDRSWMDYFLDKEMVRKGRLMNGPRFHEDGNYRVPPGLELYEDSLLTGLQGLTPRSQTAHLFEQLMGKEYELRQAKEVTPVQPPMPQETTPMPIPPEGIFVIRVGARYMTFPAATQICEETTRKCYTLDQLLTYLPGKLDGH